MHRTKWFGVLGALALTQCIQSAEPDIVRYVRFSRAGHTRYGIFKEDRIQVIDGDLFGTWKPTAETVALRDVKLLAPCIPSKVLAMAYNFATHTVDRDRPPMPLAFAKLPTCIINPEDAIIRPADSKNLHYEGELVVVFKKLTKSIAKEQVRDHLLGVTIGNDVTDRDWQKQEAQWLRAKASDTFGPLGPWIVTGLDYNNLLIETRVNGVTVQSENTRRMFFSVDECVSYFSRYITFFPGDILFLGTPGVTKPMKPGDRVEVEIQGIGVLRNVVKAAQPGEVTPARAGGAAPANDDN